MEPAESIQSKAMFELILQDIFKVVFLKEETRRSPQFGLVVDYSPFTATWSTE